LPWPNTTFSGQKVARVASEWQVGNAYLPPFRFRQTSLSAQCLNVFLCCGDSHLKVLGYVPNTRSGEFFGLDEIENFALAIS
jgi:hypothetical protein